MDPCWNALLKVHLWPYLRSSHADRLIREMVTALQQMLLDSVLKSTSLTLWQSCLDKLDWEKNCAQIADHFVNAIEQTNGRLDEVPVIFDKYDLPISLKEATNREEARRPGQILLTSQTFKCWRSFCHTLKCRWNSLFFTQTRQWSMYYRRQSGRRFVVAWGSECNATHKDVQYLRSNQEEADTKVILHAVDAI